MSSTYSTNLALELIGTGDQAGTWGNTTNTNLGTLIEQAISGYVTQAVSTGTDTTITIPNGATGVARNMYIELTGTGGASTNLIVPANKKLYFIFNNASGAVTVKVSGQTGVSVPAGKKVVLASNGTDTVNALNYIADFGSNSATITQLTATSATITNLTLTSLVISNLSIASANITTLTSASATITNLIATSASITTLTNNPTFSAGTANGVLFLDGSKVATSGSALTFDGNTLKSDTASTTVDNFRIENGSLNRVMGMRLVSSGVQFDAFDQNNSASQRSFLWLSGGSEKMSLTSTSLYTASGINVGIGTSSPTTPLDVTKAGGGNFVANFQNTTSATPYGVSIKDAATPTAGYPLLQISNSAGSSVYFRVDSSTGNVGIGTSSPAQRLHVQDSTPNNGTIQLGGASFYGTIKHNATGTGANEYVTASASGGGHQFFRGTTLQFMTDSSGNLGLGVSPSAWSVGKAIEVGAVGNSIWGNGAGNIRVLSNAYYNGAFKYATSAAASQYTQDGGTHAWSIAPSWNGTGSDVISFTQAMTLDASGNLGVGKTSPITRLDVSSSFGSTPGYANTTLSLGSSATAGVDVGPSLVFYGQTNNPTPTYAFAGLQGVKETSSAGNYAGALLFLTQNSGGSATLGERARITSGGSFQVTADGSNQTFTSSGQIALKNSGSDPYVSFHSSTGTRLGYLQMQSSGVAALAVEANQPLLFYTNSINRARITSAGYSKFSNDGTYLGSTSDYHEFRSDITVANATLFVHNFSASCTSDGIIQSRASRNTADNTFYFFSAYNDASSAYKLRIADSGNVTNTNGSYGTISDAKMKTDIVDAGSQWADVKALRFRKFRMKDDPSGITQLGVVAQEVEQVSPGLVEEHTDRDGDGNDLGTTTKAVKTSVLLMKAAVALQEAMARIEKLEAEMALLKGA
jgi:hypothetical protein